MAVLIVSLMLIFADSVTRILNSERDMALAELASNGARFYFTAFVFVGLTIVTTAFLSVTTAPKTAFIISILQGGALVIPLVLVMARMFGVPGVWLSYPISELALAVVSVFFLLRAKKKVL